MHLGLLMVARAKRHAARLTWAMTVVATASACVRPDPIREVAASASMAQQACHGRIHHDTDEYQLCLEQLLGQGNHTPLQQLGIEYFGYVGAMSSARMGMLGAAGTAQAFLQRFRARQRALNIDDRDLCAAVAGDCDVRIATIRQAEGGRADPS